jgi:transposase
MVRQGEIEIERLDHLGVVAGVIKDPKVRLIGLIDERLKPDAQVNVTPGEAVAAMILNGLGFVQEVISLTPDFFEDKPVGLLLREGITADQLNRHKLGRTLDSIYDYGCENFFNEIALTICLAEGIDLGVAHNDTTTFSVMGEYDGQDQETEVQLTHGYSKAKRPDLKQIVLELCVAKGGHPFIMKPWSGNASDNKIFNARLKALCQSAVHSHTGRTIADSKLYTRENMKELGALHFITRLPASIKEEQEYIAQSLQNESWCEIGNGYRLQVFDVNHYDLEQRWIVFYSRQAHERAKKTLVRFVQKQEAQLSKDLSRLKKQQFKCAADACAALDIIVKKYTYHQLQASQVLTIERYEKAGKPKSGAKKRINFYQISATFNVVQATIDAAIDRRSCFVLATNIPAAQLASVDVLKEYEGQDVFEKSFGFMKEPSFFASSFYLKSVSRIQALLVVMTLALLIYTIAQSRLRRALAAAKKTVPNQIKKPIEQPTLRWAFYLLRSINIVKFFHSVGPDHRPIRKIAQTFIEGITELKKLILSCLGVTVMKIYGITEPPAELSFVCNST